MTHWRSPKQITFPFAAIPQINVKYLLLWLLAPVVTLPSSLCDISGKRLMAIASWLWSSSRLYKDFTGNKNELQGKTDKVLLAISVLSDRNTTNALFVISTVISTLFVITHALWGWDPPRSHWENPPPNSSQTRPIKRKKTCSAKGLNEESSSSSSGRCRR